MTAVVECPTCHTEEGFIIVQDTEWARRICHQCGQVFFWCASVEVEVFTETIETKRDKLKLSIKRHEEVGITDVANRLKAVLAELEATYANHD